RAPSLPPHPAKRIVPPPPGYIASTSRNFCNATSARLPIASVTSIGGDEKSKSGAFSSGQFVLSGRRQAVFHASPVVICFDQRIFPVSRSMATNESLMFEAGAL